MVRLVLMTLLGASSAASLPNLIFVLSDDLGYGDVSISPGVNRSKASISTPNIQRLADNGMKFLRAYSGQVCAPSRCSLITGRHTGHCTIRGNDGAYTPLLPTDSTVASVLNKTHVTGIVGKWGLGNFGSTGYPLAQGFNYFVGQDSQVACHDWYPISIQNNTIGTQHLNDEANLSASCLTKEGGKNCIWANDLTKNEAVGFIRQHAKGPRPFFLYLSTTTPHAGSLKGSSKTNPVPYPYNEAGFINDSWGSKNQDFAAAVWAQDAIVGAVLDELEIQKIEEDTIVFFAGDNGPDSHDFTLFDDPGPFRGKKRSLHEGGIRQTIAVQWKGKVPAGTTSEHLFAFWDLLPTAAELAGIPEAQWPETDGVSIAPILTGQNSKQKEHDFLYWEFCYYGKASGLLPQQYPGGWIQALRWDKAGTEWKAIRVDRGDMLLYNLTADISETSNIAGKHPDAVKNAARLMEQEHDESHTWPSVQDSSEKCCASCFNPKGCPAPCANMGPSPPPAPPPAPSKPFAADELNGAWDAHDSGGDVHFNIAVDGTNITIKNVDDSTSCWTSGVGSINLKTGIITALAIGDKCTRHAHGTVTRNTSKVYVDEDYQYLVTTYTIHWTTKEGNGWPVWKMNSGFSIDMAAVEAPAEYPSFVV